MSYCYCAGAKKTTIISQKGIFKFAAKKQKMKYRDIFVNKKIISRSVCTAGEWYLVQRCIIWFPIRLLSIGQIRPQLRVFARIYCRKHQKIRKNWPENRPPLSGANGIKSKQRDEAVRAIVIHMSAKNGRALKWTDRAILQWSEFRKILVKISRFFRGKSNITPSCFYGKNKNLDIHKIWAKGYADTKNQKDWFHSRRAMLKMRRKNFKKIFHFFSKLIFHSVSREFFIPCELKHNLLQLVYVCRCARSTWIFPFQDHGHIQTLQFLQHCR